MSLLASNPPSTERRLGEGEEQGCPEKGDSERLSEKQERPFEGEALVV